MGRSHQRSVPLFVETLEDRRLLAGNVISGYVFDDVNGNGLRDVGEAVIANNLIELRNSANVVVGTTTTDANGFYSFNSDSTISQAIQTQVQTVNFANGKANTISSQLLSQFNPALGTLQSIQIKVDGRIISDIKLENLDDELSVVSGKVSGNVLVSGPGFNLNVNIAGNAAISKTLPAFDGTIDFGGTSGVSLGSTTATGSNSQTLTGSAMSSYIGAGTVNLSFLAQATTQASGGGNLTANITNQGGGTVTVTYSYIKNNALQPGNYKIIQKVQPAGLLDGRDSQAGVIVANSFNTDILSVTLNNTDSTDNNFGEYEPASLKGYVYADNNNNGFREATETVFANIKIKLTGTDDRGTAINLTVNTDGTGLYSFGNLRPGKYTITESTTPTGYNSGKITAGSLGGTLATTRTINNITTPVGAAGVDNNFGHIAIKPPSSTGITIGKDGYLGSTPKPVTPPDSTVVTPGVTIGKDGYLGSTPSTTTTTTPSAGVTVTTPPATGITVGKDGYLGSTPKPPASNVVTGTTIGKDGYLGSTPTTTTAVKAASTTAKAATTTKPASTTVVTTTKPATFLRF